jgi:multiple sugar transport system permease protein
MGRRHKGVSYAKYGYIFSIPFVLAFLIFMLYPLGYTTILGFTDYSGFAAVETGEFSFLEDPFENFKLLFENQLFITSLQNTFKIWIMNFIPQILLALLLTAWFTNRRSKMKGQGAFKVLFYMPNIITAASIAILFNVMFMFPIGPINFLLQRLGFENAPYNFVNTPSSAQYIVAFIQFWMWYGYTMLILISGVLGLNPEMYEVSEIDGANGVQQFFFITLPNLKTILLYMLVTSTVGGLSMFDIPRIFNDGQPDNATMTASLFIYRQAFAGRFMFNRAAAASMIVFAIIAILSVTIFFLLRDKDAARLKREEKALKRAIKAEGGAV